MQSRRDRVQAHNFMVGRLGTAMLEGDPNAVDAPMRRTRNGNFIGLAIAALVCVGFLVFGLIFPGGASTWRQEGTLIVEKETGATYLYSSGMLRPVANFTSAKLIQGDQLTVRSVSAKSLEGVPAGGPVGIPGAPDSLPSAENLGSEVWRLCAVPPTDDFPPRVSLTVSVEPRADLLPRDLGVLVSSPDGEHHLLWHDTRLRLDSGGGALEALGYGTSPVLEVTDSFLDSVPAGPDLAAPEIAGLGEDGPVLAGRSTAVGQVFVVSGQEQAEQHYVLARDGLAPLTSTESRLLLAHPGVRETAYGGATPAPVELTAADIQGQLAPADEAQPSGDSPLPANPPELFSVDLATSCLQLAEDGRLELALQPVDAISAWPVQEIPAIAPGCPTPELMGIPAGGGGLVEASPIGGSATAPTYYLVTDTAAKYPVTDAETVAVLGFDAASATPVPTSILRLIPTGPLLNPAMAALPVTPSERVENTECPQ
ncbi:type VII secretion protein EccB [Actinorugispora endophytica]|uniref:Type VII secretion protein EccB n=1 Tax=Actinorugispora endophytica TaxID=1605990 RepID=A0A4R6UD80_9ACTN|nr:type VII secretion protein EccB [Actinorugispora endophytica]TDQ44660.1 type VII secretion protein EccB [Actinorugispora endophytica]